MHNDLITTETHPVSAEHRGFVDNCIALIENLLEKRPLNLPQLKPADSE